MNVITIKKAWRALFSREKGLNIEENSSQATSLKQRKADIELALCHCFTIHDDGLWVGNRKHWVKELPDFQVMAEVMALGTNKDQLTDEHDVSRFILNNLVALRDYKVILFGGTIANEGVIDLHFTAVSLSAKIAVIFCEKMREIEILKEALRCVDGLD